MSRQVRILGIAGSLRRDSYNRAALRAATELCPEGASIETFDIEGIPGFNQDEEQNPPATPYHAINRALPQLNGGSTVVMIGVGGLGHMAIQLVRVLAPVRIR